MDRKSSYSNGFGTLALALVALFGSVTITAIVTQYDGIIDLRVGSDGGQLRIEGRSNNPAVSPPAD